MTAQYLNHPALDARLSPRGRRGRRWCTPPTTSRTRAAGRCGTWLAASIAEDRRHAAISGGADLLIHDAQYTASEYPAKVGWGHSTVEYVVDVAVAADVKRLVLFHHDPLRDDAALDAVLDNCRERVATMHSNLEVVAAAEGLRLDVAPALQPAATMAEHEPSAEDQADVPPHPKVLVADDEPDVLLLLTRTLRTENFDLITASDGEAALLLARMEFPDLILLDWHMPRLDGLAVSRTLRAESDARLRDVPIVLITGHTGAEDMEEGFAAGVTDYLTKPFTPAHLRTRARAWLLRGRANG